MKRLHHTLLTILLFSFAVNPQSTLKWHNIVSFTPNSVSLDPHRTNLLWVVGNGGLFRYDLISNTWTSFNTADGLSKIWGECLYIENDKIWVGTEAHGANIFDLQNERFTPFLQYCNQGYTDEYCPSVISIYPDENNVWIGTMEDGLYLVDKITLDTLKRFTKKDGLGENCIYYILDDSEYLWLATAYCGMDIDYPPPTGGISRVNKLTYQIDNFRLPNDDDENYFYSLAFVDDTIWAAGSRGLFTFNRTSGTFSRILKNQISWAKYILVDDENVWCVGFSGGYDYLFKINKSTRQIDNPILLSINSTVTSNSGSLFFGMGRNLYKLDKSSFDLEQIPDDFLPSTYCYGIDGNEDEIYAGSGDNIVKINNSDFSYSILDEPGINIRNITLDEDYLWVCTDQGLFKYRNTQPLELLKRYFNSEMVFCAKNQNNYLWISTHLGLYRLNKTDDEIIKKDFTNELNTFGTPKISDILLDSENVWLCFSGKADDGDLISGIVEINSQTLSTVRKKILSIDNYTLAIGSLNDQGDYLLASGGEISRINKRDLSIETFIDQKTSLITVNDTLLWAVLNFGGIKVYNINTKEELYHVTESDGLLHNFITDFYINKNDAFFTTYGGISILDISSLLNITGVPEDKSIINNFLLFQNYPNPFTRQPISDFEFRKADLSL